MLWAIDIGNTHTVIGIHDGEWRQVWRLSTRTDDTEDQTASVIHGLCHLAGLPMSASCVLACSVVPSANSGWKSFAAKYLGVEAIFVSTGQQVGIRVDYDPPHAVGADRIVNALAATKKFGAPVIIVDFGTATTCDTVSSDGAYLGGAIIPGLQTSCEALALKAAKLPTFELQAPETAIGTNTVGALRSGVMLGHAGAVDRVVSAIQEELGSHTPVIGTGGLAVKFQDLCESIETVDELLTLDGLLFACKIMLQG